MELMILTIHDIYLDISKLMSFNENKTESHTKFISIVEKKSFRVT